MVENIPRMETIKTTAKLSGISEDALRKMVSENKIIYFKIGRKTLINVDRLVDLLNSGSLA